MARKRREPLISDRTAVFEGEALGLGAHQVNVSGNLGTDSVNSHAARVEEVSRNAVEIGADSDPFR